MARAVMIMRLLCLALWAAMVAASPAPILNMAPTDRVIPAKSTAAAQQQKEPQAAPAAAAVTSASTASPGAPPSSSLQEEQLVEKHQPASTAPAATAHTSTEQVEETVPIAAAAVEEGPEPVKTLHSAYLAMVMPPPTSQTATTASTTATNKNKNDKASAPASLLLSTQRPHTSISKLSDTSSFSSSSSSPSLSSMPASISDSPMLGHVMTPVSSVDCSKNVISDGLAVSTIKRLTDLAVEAHQPTGATGSTAPPKWELETTPSQPPRYDRKVAYCILGSLRALDITAKPHLQHAVTPLHADLFVHTVHDDKASQAKDLLNATGDMISFRSIPSPVDPAGYLDELAGSPEAIAAWRASAPPAIQPGARWLHYGGLPEIGKGSGFIQYTHMYGCQLLIAAEEARRGSKYQYIAVARSDYLWLADHPPASIMSPATFYSPDNINDYWGLTDMYMIGGRNVMLPYMSILKDVAKQTARGQSFMDWKRVPAFSSCTADPWGSVDPAAGDNLCVDDVNPERKLAQFLADEGTPVAKLPNVGILVCPDCSSEAGCPAVSPASEAQWAPGCRWRENVMVGVKKTDAGVDLAFGNSLWVNRCGWTDNILRAPTSTADAISQINSDNMWKTCSGPAKRAAADT